MRLRVYLFFWSDPFILMAVGICDALDSQGSFAFGFEVPDGLPALALRSALIS
jgi:hypothetical protein